VSGEGDHIEAAPIGSRTANYAVVDRIRDLAKWLLVVLGAISGVLLAGSKLSDIGATHGDNRVHALIGVGVGLIGAAIALGFIARVLLPIRLTLSELEFEAERDKPTEPEGWSRWKRLKTRLRRKFSPVRALVVEEALVLSKYDSIADLKCNWKKALGKPKGERKEIDDAVYEFLAYALAEKVKRRMMWASGAVALGATLAALGIVVFSVATHEVSGSPSAGEAVPKRLSAVVVRLTPTGREKLIESLGRRCVNGRVRAIALGGTPDAIKMTSVPSARCRTAHFTLLPNIGSVIDGERLRTLRACTLPHPRIPCLVYPNSAALIAGES
jgi:hypothetical protein